MAKISTYGWITLWIIVMVVPTLIFDSHIWFFSVLMTPIILFFFVSNNEKLFQIKKPLFRGFFIFIH